MNFVLNTKTKVLHYKGYCYQTKDVKRLPDNFQCFKSENEARQNDAINIRWCKVCAKQRENLSK